MITPLRKGYCDLIRELEESYDAHLIVRHLEHSNPNLLKEIRREIRQKEMANTLNRYIEESTAHGNCS